MENISTLFPSRGFNMETIFKMNDVSVDVQRHIGNVFAALAGMLFAAFFGVIGYLKMHVNPLIPFVGLLLGMLFLSYDTEKTNLKKRIPVLLAVGFCKGLAIGNLVEVVLFVDSSILITATLSTSAIFLCFCGAALTAKRRSFFYLQGFISAAASVMLVSSLVSFFAPSSFNYNLQLYGGLILFCGYVILDTQMMIEKAVQGSRDVAGHALELFLDFVSIFVKICIILLQNSEKKDKKKRRA